MEPPSRSTDFVALGHPGSDHYAGLETFANPGVSHVEMTSDELSTICPVTGQPDLYVATPLRTGVQRHRDPTPSPRNLETSKPHPTKAGTAPGVLVAFPPNCDSDAL